MTKSCQSGDIEMTHDYSYGANLATAHERFETHSRQTGRTHAMMQQLRDGDTIVTCTSRKANHLRTLANSMGLKIEVKLLAGRSVAASPVAALKSSKGRIFVDHRWIHEFWENHLREGREELAWMQGIINPDVSEKQEGN
jgi:hypothetical protein